jgi:hypothetical protein
MAHQGGNSLIFRTAMGYDTGSTSLSIFTDELPTLVGLQGIPLAALVQIQIRTPTGISDAYILPFYMRVLTENHQHTLIDWHLERAIVSPRPDLNAVRLSSLSLDRTLFVCTSPYTRRLYAAQYKTRCFRIVPAT